MYITHIQCVLMFASSTVTADIDKALLCTENAVEIALNVRKQIVIVVCGFNAHIACVQAVTHYLLCINYWLSVLLRRICGIVLTVVSRCHVNAVWPTLTAYHLLTNHWSLWLS